MESPFLWFVLGFAFVWLTARTIFGRAWSIPLVLLFLLPACASVGYAQTVGDGEYHGAPYAHVQWAPGCAFYTDGVDGLFGSKYQYSNQAPISDHGGQLALVSPVMMTRFDGYWLGSANCFREYNTPGVPFDGPKDVKQVLVVVTDGTNYVDVTFDGVKVRVYWGSTGYYWTGPPGEVATPLGVVPGEPGYYGFVRLNNMAVNPSGGSGASTQPTTTSRPSTNPAPEAGAVGWYDDIIARLLKSDHPNHHSGESASGSEAPPKSLFERLVNTDGDVWVKGDDYPAENNITTLLHSLVGMSHSGINPITEFDAVATAFGDDSSTDTGEYSRFSFGRSDGTRSAGKQLVGQIIAIYSDIRFGSGGAGSLARRFWFLGPICNWFKTIATGFLVLVSIVAIAQCFVRALGFSTGRLLNWLSIRPAARPDEPPPVPSWAEFSFGPAGFQNRPRSASPDIMYEGPRDNYL